MSLNVGNEMTRLTLKAVNKAIAAKGIKAELVKGEGYFYFIGDAVETGHADSTSVWAFSLNQLNLDAWLDELDVIVAKANPVWA